ncbi:hypothetical protein KDL44_03420 [bacterium]|nr:hypothetical protein [bacterium]
MQVRICVAIVTGLSACQLASCGGPDPGGAPAAPETISATSETGEQSMALAELAALELPEDVDEQTFKQLKAGMEELLRNHSGRATTGSDIRQAAGSAYYDSDPGYFDYFDNQFSRYDYYDELDLPCPPGDFDQNGIVNCADIVPLACELGRTPEDIGAHPASDAYFYLQNIDWDGNGLITAADMVGIAANFGVQIETLSMFSSKRMLDYPWYPDGGDRIKPERVYHITELYKGGPDERMHFPADFLNHGPDDINWSVLELSDGRRTVSRILRSRQAEKLQLDLGIRAGYGGMSFVHVNPLDMDSDFELDDPDPETYRRLSEDAWQADHTLPDARAGLDLNGDGHVGNADGLAALHFLKGFRREDPELYEVFYTRNYWDLPHNGGDGRGLHRTEVHASLLPSDGGFPPRLDCPTGFIPDGSYVWLENQFVRSEYIWLECGHSGGCVDDCIYWE